MKPALPTARREFLRQVFWTAGAMGAFGSSALLGSTALAQAAALPRRIDFRQLGPLMAPDANGIRLPVGFSSRIVAVSGERPTPRSSYRWHVLPDGGATFATPDGGWVYANNSEVPLIGGVGALRFDAAGNVVDAYRVLSGTSTNCAGGKTPWGTWLSCEEHDLGRVWECNPLGSVLDARVRAALGVFKHEAVAVDPVNKILYLTEDDGEGRFYRYVCGEQDWPAGASRPALRHGRLQVLQFAELPGNVYPGADFDLMRARAVVWRDVVLPGLPQALVRGQLGSGAPGSVFKGGEGLWFFEGIAYFSTKGDNRIWAYDHAAQSLEVIYDFSRATAPGNVLSGVDNLTVSAWGDVLVAEDGGNMELCVIAPDRSVHVLLQVTGQDGSELTGPAFSPDGSRLYVNSQRGGRSGGGLGITYEIRLPV
jgi:secreted PhoX family phosphatase